MLSTQGFDLQYRDRWTLKDRLVEVRNRSRMCRTFPPIERGPPFSDTTVYSYWLLWLVSGAQKRREDCADLSRAVYILQSWSFIGSAICILYVMRSCGCCQDTPRTIQHAISLIDPNGILTGICLRLYEQYWVLRKLLSLRLGTSRLIVKPYPVVKENSHPSVRWKITFKMEDCTEWWINKGCESLSPRISFSHGKTL